MTRCESLDEVKMLAYVRSMDTTTNTVASKIDFQIAANCFASAAQDNAAGKVRSAAWMWYQGFAAIARINAREAK